MASALYICYFGLREPLVQTQVLPYLREIVEDGAEIHLLTFEPELEKWDAAEIERSRSTLADDGIAWHRLRYHKRPSVLATIYDLAVGTLKVLSLGRKHRFQIYHSRGHIPAPIACIAKRVLGGKFLFDIRGFMPEEYADAGIWKEGSLLFHAVKRVERWLMRSADGFVVLTEAARGILFPESRDDGTDNQGRPVEVIPCCVDLSERRFAIRSKIARQGSGPVVTHVGALGGLYLTNEIVGLMTIAKLRDPSTFALFLTKHLQEHVRQLMENAGFKNTDFVIRSVPPAEIADEIAESFFGISLVIPSFSSKSRSPTKIPEYLAAGVPVISNSGVGDVDAMITENRVGVLLHELSDAAFDRALDELEELYKEGGLRQRCRETSKRLFDLEEVGGVRYRRIYKALMN